MNSPKNWLAFMLVLTIILLVFMAFDAIVAGLLCTILLLFEVSIAIDIAKWTFISLLGLQFLSALPLLLHIFDEGGNQSGT